MWSSDATPFTLYNMFKQKQVFNKVSVIVHQSILTLHLSSFLLLQMEKAQCNLTRESHMWEVNLSVYAVSMLKRIFLVLA